MKIASIALALAFLAGCAGAPPRPTNIARDDYAAVRQYGTTLIRHEMDKSATTGLSIALIDDQRVVWAEGFGYADKEAGIPASAQTLYRVGSISKLFTDTAAMQLADQGRLDIDQPLRRYLPDFSIRSRYSGSEDITLRQLMTHHAGLPRDHGPGFMTAQPAPFTDLAHMLQERDATYPPGLLLSYSNVGITLLGHAIQNVSGSPYADYMKRAVLDPLGMTHSAFAPGPSDSPSMAKAYRKGKVKTEPALRDVPAGGLNASVSDLARFISMVFADGRAGEHRILKPETLAEMLRPQNTDVPLDFNFRVGLGWMLSTLGASTIENAGPVAHHSGATAFFHAQMYLLPAHKVGVVVLSNSDGSGQVVDHVATETLTLALEAKTGIRQPAIHHESMSERPIAAAEVAEYRGDYTTLAGFAHIHGEGGTLRADAMGRTFGLIPRGNGEFGLDYAVLGLFHPNLGPLGDMALSRRQVAGRDVLVARIGSQEMLAGERIEASPSLGAWRARLGTYDIADRGDDYRFVETVRLVEEHGFLLAEVRPAGEDAQAERIPMRILSDDEALLLGPLDGGGETVRSEVVGSEHYLSLWGYRLRRTAR